MNRYEILVIMVTALLALYVIKLIWRMVTKGSRERIAKEVANPPINKFWPKEQWAAKVLAQGRSGAADKTGAIAVLKRGPVFFLPSDEWTDWSSVQHEKRILVRKAEQMYAFDKNDPDCKLACSNRISTLDHDMRYQASIEEREYLSKELARTLRFLARVYGATSREIAKAALPVKRKHLVDNFFDGTQLVKKHADNEKARPTGVADGYELLD